MREYEIKLANVKKSCNTVRKVAKVLSIFFAVISVVMLVGGIFMFAFRSDINKYTSIEEVDGKMVAHICDKDGTEYTTLYNLVIKSSLGAIDFTGAFVNKGMAAEGMGVGFFILAAFTGILFGIFVIIMNAFKVIGNSDSSFNETVMKKLKTAFIIITVYTFFSVGLGASVLAGVVFWCIYCILDYGYALQKEADETL